MLPASSRSFDKKSFVYMFDIVLNMPLLLVYLSQAQI